METRPGESLTADTLIPKLFEDIEALIGPCKKIPSVLVHKNGFTNTILAGKPKLGLRVYKMLDQLDFTPTKGVISGSYGGFRPENNKLKTYVNYCEASGVLVVTTNLPDLTINASTRLRTQE